MYLADRGARVGLVEAAGTQVPEAHPPVNARVDAVLARHGSAADPARRWSGEGP